MPHFRIRQGGATVAQASGPDALTKIMHRAEHYRQDGELTIQVQHVSPTTPGKWYWKRFALLAQWPDENAVK